MGGCSGRVAGEETTDVEQVPAATAQRQHGEVTYFASRRISVLQIIISISSDRRSFSQSREGSSNLSSPVDAVSYKSWQTHLNQMQMCMMRMS